MLTKVKQERIFQGKKQKDVLKDCFGVLNQYKLSTIEAGAHPNAAEAAAIAFALGLEISDLWGPEDVD